MSAFFEAILADFAVSGIDAYTFEPVRSLVAELALVMIVQTDCHSYLPVIFHTTVCTVVPSPKPILIRQHRVAPLIFNLRQVGCPGDN